MTRLIGHRNCRRSLLGMSSVFVMVAMAFRASAAISEGPTSTNAAVAEEHRQMQFHEAELSFQDKLRVGRGRYEKKQMERAKVIQAMSAQLQARQAMVVIQPVGNPGDHNGPTIPNPGPSLAGVALALSFIGLGFYLKRLNQTSPAAPFPQAEPPPVSFRPVRAKYRITALRPVTICARVEVCKTGRKLAWGRVRPARDQPAWIKLKAGEMRDKVGIVLGIHPECAPRGRRIYLADAGMDIVPLGAWTDGELPKDFFGFFILEASD